MIDSAMTPGAIKTGMLALRMAVQQERDSAVLALREAEKSPAFDGKSASAPHVGNIMDIDV